MLGSVIKRIKCWIIDMETLKIVLSMFSYIWSTCSCRGVRIHYSERVHGTSVARGDGAIQLVLHDGQLLGDPVNITLELLGLVL